MTHGASIGSEFDFTLLPDNIAKADQHAIGCSLETVGIQDALVSNKLKVVFAACKPRELTAVKNFLACLYPVGQCMQL